MNRRRILEGTEDAMLEFTRSQKDLLTGMGGARSDKDGSNGSSVHQERMVEVILMIP